MAKGVNLKVITPTWDITGVYYVATEEMAAQKVAAQDDMDEGPYCYCGDEDLTAKIIAAYDDLEADLPMMATTEEFAIATYTDCWYLAEITLF